MLYIDIVVDGNVIIVTVGIVAVVVICGRRQHRRHLPQLEVLSIFDRLAIPKHVCCDVDMFCHFLPI